jgi:hypothetical protein
MAYKVIRVSEDYGVVVVACGEEAAVENPDSPELTFFEHNDHVERSAVPFFAEVTRNRAIQYFSGIADGLGWGDEMPRTHFASLEEVEAWARKKAEAWASCRLEELLPVAKEDVFDLLAADTYFSPEKKRAMLSAHGLLEEFEARHGKLVPEVKP